MKPELIEIARAILYEHEDGRYAVNPDTTGDPKWHRLGPVEVFHPSTGSPVAQWQKRHRARTNGKWENTDEHDAKWWRDQSVGWEIRALYTHPAPSTPAAQEPVALDHIACIEDGELRYMSGRCAPAFDCELYAMPEGKSAPKLYALPPMQQEGLSDRTVCAYPDCHCPTETPCLQGLPQPEPSTPAAQEPPGGDWYCEEHPEHLMDHDGCTGAGIPECARVGQIANQLRLARQEARETARHRDDLVAQYRSQAATLREAVEDAADEYARYVVEDTAPRTLGVHMMAAFDAALGGKP